ncbi:hypothetical protein [Olleya sp. R77988]|uniref:hypothetical protein n=1 Tax=Olleya sp. R77988 TaxID=3093875 RepID=UPI0037CB9A08
MDYDSIYDYRETHSDFRELICEHQGTELYQEIIHYMNWLYPKWNSNLGIGYGASEFILTAIQNLEGISDFSSENRQTNLETLYEQLSFWYARTKEWYQSTLKENMYDKFKASFIDFEYLDDICDFEHDKLYSAFVKKEMSKIYYEF